MNQLHNSKSCPVWFPFIQCHFLPLPLLFLCFFSSSFRPFFLYFFVSFLHFFYFLFSLFFFLPPRLYIFLLPFLTLPPFRPFSPYSSFSIITTFSSSSSSSFPAVYVPSTFFLSLLITHGHILSPPPSPIQ